MFTVEALCNVHSHLREVGDVMKALIAMAVRGGADVILPMPNTKAGLVTGQQVMGYCSEVWALVPPCAAPRLIPTLMITESTPEEEPASSVKMGVLDAKIYPRDRTTKSENGVRDYSRLLPIITACGKVGMTVHLHPEHPWMVFGNRDAEFGFLSIADMFLRQTNATIIWEHGTDARCIPFWKEMAKTGRFFVTITAHHLAGNEDGSFGDVRSVCKPPLKTELDRQDLVHLVTENYPWVMAGGDDAAHDVTAKHVHEGQCACGAYTGPFLLQLYAHALSDLLKSGEAGKQIFINFTSRNGRRLHGLPDASRTFTLENREVLIPPNYAIGPWTVEPFWAGKKLDYCLS